MISSVISTTQKNLDKGTPVRNVAAKIVQDMVPESTAKTLVRIVGMWVVMGAIANILKSPVQLVGPP